MVCSAASSSWRATVAVTAMSIVTLPKVRKISGKVSTAINKAKGSTGAPRAKQMGAMELIKLIEPGRLTAPNVVVAAAAMPKAICAGPNSTPNQWAI